jgi:PAS domain S-box-containing protein
MIHSIKRWLAPPVFPEDEERTGQIALINATLLGPILLLLVFLVILCFDRSLPRTLLIVDLGALALSLQGLRWLHAGKVGLAVAGLVLVGYLGTTAVNISLGTVRTPMASMYLFWVLMAGAVFHLRGLLLATGVSSLTILGLILAENAGRLPKPDYSVGLTQWVTYTSLFAMAAVLIYYANQRTRLALHRAEREIAQRRQSDAELHESHDILQSILSATTDGFLQIDDQGRLLDVNTRYCVLSGYAREELMQMNLTELMLVADRAVIAERQRHIMENGNIQFESRHRRKDGEVWDVEVSVVHRREVSGQFFVFVRDIGERMRREQELRQLSEAVAQSTESIVITNLKGEIEYVNDAYVKNTGYSRHELMGRNSRLLQSGKTPRATYDTLWQALRQGQSWSGEFFNRRKDGSEFVEAAIISPIRGPDGRVRNYVAAKRDITQDKQIQVELQQAQQAAEAANLAKSQFLATMSHEVRTPLNGILGMAQVLLIPGVSEADRLDYARTILSSGQTLLKLLNDILDLAKIEAGKIEFEAIEMAPTEILTQTQALFSVAARARGLQIESSWAGPNTHYLGDPHRLTQMLSNLVNNALKFTNEGSIRIEAREIARAGHSATLEFSVSDSGIGIASDKLGLLFQSFSQVDSSSARQFGGTGLGLSIVRALAHLMGGETGVESALGVGSRFWFRVAVEPLAASSEAPPVPQPLAADALRSGRVLLVEDNVDHGRLMELLLGSLGVEVLAVNNGQKAFDVIVQGESAPVVLMDLQMPLLDGYDATRQIRQWEQQNGTSRRAIIALTASAFEDDRQRCLAAGIDDVLTKPVSFERLKAVLAQWMPVSAVPGPQSTGAAINVPQVLARMRELEPLLENIDFDAVARFRDLQEALAGTELAAPLAPAAEALQAYQFDLVLLVLRQIMNNPAWQGESHDRSKP